MPSVSERVSNTLALAALGVVFGDIGTSSLYTLKACFVTAHVSPTPDNVLGIVSALLWTLILVVCVKYITFVMQVDNRGEGGILALLARLMPAAAKGISPPLTALMIVGIVGGAALLGDGLITPAISVLSAVEGLSVATPAALTWEVPITVAVLLGLFVIQARGTQKLGFLFGPVMTLWFAGIAIVGAVAIVHHPAVAGAVNPIYAIRFMLHHGLFGFLMLGATILCVTGAEALYADMSHFGRRPIAMSWYLVVFPALILNYMGQGAAVLGNPHALENAFYSLSPGWTLVPMIALATAATVIASQALISGAFTVVEQGIALNLVPRTRIVHTSNRYPGQVYAPAINVLLAIGCALLVVFFRTSDHLAAAYGLAVSLTMAATTILFCAVIRRVLHWNRIVSGTIFAAFIIMDGSFVIAGLAKIPNGGWLPLTLTALLSTFAITWYVGRRRLAAAMAENAMPVEQFLAVCRQGGPPRIEGTAVFLTGNPEDVPYILHYHWLRMQALHERIVLLTLSPAYEPFVDRSKRVTVDRLAENLIRVHAHFGFMELPDLKPILDSCVVQGLDLGDDKTSFYVAAPKIVRANEHAMWPAQRWLFEIMLRLVGTIVQGLEIPSSRLVQLAVDVPM